MDLTQAQRDESKTSKGRTTIDCYERKTSFSSRIR